VSGVPRGRYHGDLMLVFVPAPESVNPITPIATIANPRGAKQVPWRGRLPWFSAWSPWPSASGWWALPKRWIQRAPL